MVGKPMKVTNTCQGIPLCEILRLEFEFTHLNAPSLVVQPSMDVIGINSLQLIIFVEIVPTGEPKHKTFPLESET